MFSHQESEAKEQERREKEREEIEKKCKKYYKAHMKKEMERLKNWVNWYEVKLDEIREAPIDERPQKLGRLYRISEKNKHLEVMIDSVGIINPVNCPGYPPELELPKDNNNNEEFPFCNVRDPRLPVPKTYNQLDYFKQIISELIRGKMKMLLNMFRKLRP